MIEPKQVHKLVNTLAPYLMHNGTLIDIFEENLLPYLEKDLCDQMSLQAFEQIKYRIAPINVLPKIIDKLTNIYQTSVIREVIDGTESDKQLLSWYQEKLDLNNQLNCANELFNLCKATLIQPFVYEMKPYLRVIMNDRFAPYSSDYVFPNKPTDIVVSAGKKDNQDIFHVYGKDGFYVMKADESIDFEEMLKLGNPLGENPYAPYLPFIYVSDSKYKLIPTADTSILKLTKVLPIMLSDLNLAAMFQAFAIIYMIDADDTNIKFNPNAVWLLKSDPTTNSKPEIGTIKPTVDYSQVMSLIKDELSMWLGSKGIRASSIGSIDSDNFASGISKIIDEMDTFEARQKQVTIFTNVEAQLWDLILNVMHPYWVQQGMIENTTLWTPGAKVKTTFAAQLPMQNRGQLVRDLKDEYAAGFTTKKHAISKLNPHMTSDEIDLLIKEIDLERTVTIGADDEEETEESDDSSEQENNESEDS